MRGAARHLPFSFCSSTNCLLYPSGYFSSNEALRNSKQTAAVAIVS